MWQRVVAPTALVSLLWVAVSGTTIFFLNGVDERQTQELYANRRLVLASERMLANLWRLQAAVVGASDHRRAEVTAEVAAVADDFETAFRTAQTNALAAENELLLEQIDDHFARYRQTIQRYLHLDPPHSAPPVDLTLEQAWSTAKSLEKLMELGEQLKTNSFERRAQLRSRVDLVRLGFLVAGPALGLLLGLWVARGLHQTISEISVTLKDASGDLNQEIGCVALQRDDSGDLPALHQQVQDVAGRIRQVIGELQKARQDVLRSERLAAVGELAAGVAHEIRNPLNSLQLLIQTEARKSPDQPFNTAYLPIILAEIARMEKTVQGLLDFARPPQLHRLKHDVRVPLRRALTLTQGYANQGQVQVSAALPEEPLNIQGDPEQLGLVYVNLIRNAIEAMPGGGTLHVVVQTDTRQGVCRIRFADSGNGIPPDILYRIFEPFVTTKDRGSGLGLAISRRVIQEHGGSLEASNRAEGGALIVVELPWAEPPPRAAE